MFIGHYGVSFAARARAPSVSLGAFFVAVQALDVCFAFFVLGGAEHMRIVPGFTAYNPYDLYDIPLSHSLVAALGWSVVAAGIAMALRKGRAVAILLALAVFSHFVLDLPVHTPDLTVAGAGSAKLGLGLWNHVAATLALEVAVLGIGLFLYVRDARRRDVVLGRRFSVFAASLVVLTVVTPFLPPPASPAIFAIQALGAYVGLAFWAGWIDRRAIARV